MIYSHTQKKKICRHPQAAAIRLVSMNMFFVKKSPEQSRLNLLFLLFLNKTSYVFISNWNLSSFISLKRAYSHFTPKLVSNSWVPARPDWSQ